MNSNKEEDCRVRMGEIGEKIFINFCSSNGQKVEVASDPYDSKKDLLVEGLTTEVKTQVPFILKNAFTFRPTQLKKCLNVERLIFVSVPSNKRKYKSDGKVYEIDPTKMKYHSYSTEDGRNMIVIPIDQPDMTELFTMTENEAILLQKYSYSGWN